MALVYTSDRAGRIKQLLDQGKTVEDVVKILCHGEFADGVRRLARDFAPLLGITEGKFVRLAGSRSPH